MSDKRSESSSNDTRTSNCDSAPPIEFASKVTKNVNRLRLIVVALLVIATVAVTFTVYHVVRNGQKTELETRFMGIAGRVVDAFYAIPNDKIGPLGSLRVAYTAQAEDNSSSWPFVTLTSFQQRASFVRSLSESLHVSLLPLVHENDRLKWEQYVPKTQGWM
jgi:hypothetical protein